MRHSHRMATLAAVADFVRQAHIEEQTLPTATMAVVATGVVMAGVVQVAEEMVAVEVDEMVVV